MSSIGSETSITSSCLVETLKKSDSIIGDSVVVFESAVVVVKEIRGISGEFSGIVAGIVVEYPNRVRIEDCLAFTTTGYEMNGFDRTLEDSFIDGRIISDD